jgi:hypothetical protein
MLRSLKMVAAEIAILRRLRETRQTGETGTFFRSNLLPHGNQAMLQNGNIGTRAATTHSPCRNRWRNPSGAPADVELVPGCHANA